MTNSDPTTPGSAAQRFVVRHRRGDLIFREGDPGTVMYIIHSGEVEILVEQNGNLERLATLEKGDFFGEMSLLEDLPRNASARALSDLELVRVDRATFDKMLRRNPEIAVRIMRRLSGRLRETDRRLRGGTDSVEARSEEGEAIPSFRLVHRDTGHRFPIDRAQLIVGRRDPVTGIHPEIDLSAVDSDRSSSRRHAKLYYRGGHLYLVEDIGTTNGTFVDGQRLRAGVPVELTSGSVVQFGLVEFDLLGP